MNYIDKVTLSEDSLGHQEKKFYAMSNPDRTVRADGELQGVLWGKLCQ